MSVRINPRPSIRFSPSHSRQNSSSERIGAIYQQLDPLLSNLSPESTLQALTSTSAVPSNEKAAHDILSQSISQVSPAERALGIRAAVAAQNLDLWHKEVQTWAWANQQDVKVGKGFIPPASSSDINSADSGFPSPLSTDNYYGSLPSSVVERNEKRIEEIRDGMDDLRVEELKEHVLNAHIPSRSRPSSATSSVSVPPPLSYVQLSDFTAVITATILRALPHLSRLNALLITWDVRLLVLRQIPGLLRELSITRSAIDSCLRILREPTPDSKRYADECLAADHVKLESAIVSVGRRMDRILDALEGRPDSLPEQWIDDLEAIESDFAAWVVEAEKYKVHNAWLRSKPESQAETPRAAPVQPALEKSDDHALMPVSTPAKDETSKELGNEVTTVQTFVDLPVEESNVTLKSDVPPSTDEDTHLHLSVSTSAEPLVHKWDDLTPIIVAEDSETPTQSDFPPTVSAVNGKPSGLAACSVHSDSDSKENTPPLGSQQTDGSDSPSTNTPSTPNALFENLTAVVDRPVDHSVPIKETAQPHVVIAGDMPTAELLSDVTPKDLDVSQEAQTPCQPAPQPRSIEFTPEPIGHGADHSPEAHPSRVDAGTEIPAPATVSPMCTPKTVDNRLPRIRPSIRGSQIPLASPKSGSNHTPVKPVPQHEEKPDHVQKTVRKPLQSPIKLSESRSVKPGLDKSAPMPRQISHRRRTSTGSVSSLLSDNSSLISSPDAPEPRTASPHEPPELVSSRSKAIGSPSRGVHRLREDRLRRFEQKPDPRAPFPQNRAVSLPLERFINERLELGLARESQTGVKSPLDRPITSSDFPKPPKSLSSSPVQNVSKSISSVPRPSNRRHTLSRGKSSSGLNIQHDAARVTEQHRNAFAQNTARRALEHQAEPKSLRLRKQLTAHPSLESLGVKRQELSHVEEHASELTDFGSRASSPARNLRQPRDHLDEKISSILNSLPGRIHLVDSQHEGDTSSSSSSVDRRVRHRSESPCGPPARSTTPGPSLMLMPAGRRRYSHAYKAEDSCVKLYHLHHGGQSAPTKLFVRTVGEEGQRVMVRVGGGWADLGEYLREYVIHHGRRKVSETPRVEVQGIKTRLSPSYSSPGTLLTPATSTYLTSGRATPSRPPSSLSARPASSLTVHKKRRGSTASDIMGTRAVTTGHINSFTSPPPPVPPLPTSTGRRLSVSSGYSVGDSHSPNAATEVRSTPLGLAGPRPRARYESMSPEGEAWVENVLNKTRRSSSHHPPNFTLGSPPYIDIDDRSEDSHNHSLPKVRSIGDIGSIGTSRRVVLRGLGNRRS
ncbi:unnamed protein product [Penicillium salamii]|uniref:GAR domain-containing protein n=1 Tax=Penicillium salamii TaxID=1612424 RepID=A0A9W4IWE2_9EURO|nr:unnamed protein product [Penicillium salamii]CAG8178242.1 unnamed protein product [Penicillium salamii]CAG8262311.1 unnamed protein product [Penicillium salamii]CAG8362490.1 unnamed protein product [Penicillium salamii]CAG8366208.1 unnamed protein product [Penicillium salamii]